MSYFYPILGMFRQINNSAIQTGDPYYHNKKFFQENNQDTKLCITNVGDKVVLELLDKDLIKLFYNFHDEFFKKSEFIIDNLQRFIGNSILTLNGIEAKERRAKINHIFHFTNIENYLESIIVANNRVQKAINQKTENWNCYNYFAEISTETLNNLFYGVSFQNNKCDD